LGEESWEKGRREVGESEKIWCKLGVVENICKMSQLPDPNFN
jgi:hypothetical protein